MASCLRKLILLSKSELSGWCWSIEQSIRQTPRQSLLLPGKKVLELESLRRWVIQSEIGAGSREGLTSEEHAEIKRLKSENRRLREDVAILKAAATFFAGELDPRNR